MIHIAATLLLLSSSLVAQQPPSTPPRTDGLIVGRVIDADSGRPVAGAIVSLSGGIPTAPLRVVPGSAPPGPPEPAPRYLTDGEGRFAFQRLAMASYSLNATKGGYAPGAYGRLRPEGATRSVQLTDRQRSATVVIRVFKFASLAGTLLDESGEPLVNSTVRVYRRRLSAGRRTLVAGASVQTDDRGIYRVGNLVPGEYVVSVPVMQPSVPSGFVLNGPMSIELQSTLSSPGGSGSVGTGDLQVTTDGRFLLQTSGASRSSSFVNLGADGRAYSYPTQYYPGVATMSEAMPVTLASGEERTGLDMAMRPVPTSVIGGQLLGPNGPAGTYALHLVPASGSDSSSVADVAQAITAPDGTFMFLAVPAGSYVIQTTRVPRNNPTFVNGVQQTSAADSTDAQVLWLSQPVAATGTDVLGLSLRLQPALTISGRVEFEGTSERPPASRLIQIPVMTESATAAPTAVMAPGRVDASGRFSTSGFVPGKYLVRVGGSPAGWSVKSITINGVDVSDVPFDLTKDVTNAVVTFTDRVSTLAGTVRVTTGSPEETGVLVFSTDTDRWVDFGINQRRMRVARPQPTGAFNVGPLPPGDYFAIAVRDELTSDWMDPAVLGILARSATRITIGEGDRRTIDLTVQDVRLVGGDEEFPPRPGEGGPFVDPDVDAVPSAFDALTKPRAPATSFTFALGAQARDVRVDPVGAASIAGVVVLEDAAHTPVRRVRISVTTRDMRTPRIATTDDSGRFSVSGLAPGRYVITGSKPAYLQAVYGAPRPGLSGTAGLLTLAAGQQATGITLTIARGGVITGTVLDENGQPLAEARVNVGRFQFNGGERGFLPVSGYTTDDRGSYRAFGLSPGRYVVSVAVPASMGNSDLRRLTAAEIGSAFAQAAQGPGPPAAAPPAPAPAPGQPVGYAPTYHPSAVVEEAASVLVLAAGQEINADVVLRMVRTARIEGTVAGLEEQQLRNVKVQLGMFSANGSNITGVPMTPSGFTFRNVAPGRYMLVATLSEPVGPPAANGQVTATTRTAVQELVVTGEDLTGLVLTLTEGTTFSGRLIFASSPLPPDLSLVRVMLDPASNRDRAAPIPRAGQIDAQGRFTIRGVMPGRYRVSTIAPSQGPVPAWTLTSALVGGREMLDVPIEMQPGQSVDDAVVTITTQSTELAGTIVDAARAGISGMTLALFPADRALWATSLRRRKLERSDDDGKFRFQALLPGEYLLAALTDFDQSDWGDPAFFEELAAGAIKLQLSVGEKKTQDIQVK